jgi:hypothetical protein
VLPNPSQTAPSASYHRWTGKDPEEVKWKAVDARDAADPGWRGKMEIEFYGKILDENNNPVEGNLSHLSQVCRMAHGRRRRQLHQ